MADAQRTKSIALIAGGVVIALLAGFAGGLLIRGAEVRDLEDQVTKLSEPGDADGEATQADDIQEAATEPESAEQPVTSEAAVEAPAASSATAPTAVTERQPGLIVEITGSPGAYVMRIDYVQWLTGPEANAAATAHGDESPPPNDYYVVNDNPKIREFPIQDGIPVTVVTNNDGTSDSEGHTITLAQWVAALSGPNAGAFKATIYWVTITDGTVTAIEAQYVP